MLKRRKKYLTTVSEVLYDLMAYFERGWLSSRERGGTQKGSGKRLWT